MPPTAPAPASGLQLPRFLASEGRRRLFIHDTSVMNDPGYVRPYLSAQHFFPERALWLAAPDDLVVLARPLEEAYVSYMQNLGAGPHEILVAQHARGFGATKAILDQPSYATRINSWAEKAKTPVEISVFCTTGETKKLTEVLSRHIVNLLPDPGNIDATFHANHKACVRKALRDLDIPEIPGCVVSTVGLDLSEAAARLGQAVTSLKKAYGQVIVRADYSSGGSGNLLLNHKDDACLESWLARHMNTRNFLVEAYLPWRSSPNVQYWIAPDGRAELIQITDQRMHGMASYLGNRFPAASHDDPALHRQSRDITNWLAGIGVRGVIGIDFIDTNEAGMRFVEVNARINGSTYGSAIWLRINHLRASRGLAALGCWQMRRGVATTLSNFTSIQATAGDLLYDHSKDSGVIPYWTGAMQHGICSCVTLGSNADDVHALETDFLSRVCDP